MTPLRVLIVDDEPPARRRLKRLLAHDRRASVVGEAGDADTAIRQVRALHPDLLLLDVQLPGPSGLHLSDMLPAPRPHIVFVTAFDAHAVRAFDLEALDYVLKPVSRARLSAVLDRACRAGGPPGRADRAGHGRTGLRSPVSRLTVRTGGRLDVIDVATIDWIEAAGNYVVLHCGGRRHLHRDTMARLGRRLDERRFLRIHRSAMVRLDRIVRLNPVERGRWKVTLSGGQTLRLSRGRRRAVVERLRAEGH